jgi:hypothetical protein
VAIIASNKNNNSCAWSKRFGNATGVAVTMDSNGNVLVAGS